MFYKILVNSEISNLATCDFNDLSGLGAGLGVIRLRWSQGSLPTGVE